jgi:dihydrodipicolinate reductase
METKVKKSTTKTSATKNATIKASKKTTPKAKEVSIKFTQEDTELSIIIEGSATDKNKVYGTALNELFHAVSVQKGSGARIFKLSQPIQLNVTCGEINIDTSVARVELQQRLKLNSTAKSKRAFARKFVSIADYIQREKVVISVDDLLATLEG